MFDINSLNYSQKQAVAADFGPVLVVAGAGTGKTRVLTSRIIYLMKEKKLSPSSILALTFTNKAANEMKKRITEEGFHSLEWMGTYSSIGLRILKEEIYLLNRSDNFTILDEEDQLSLVKEIYKEKMPSKVFSAKKMAHYISSLKCEGYKDISSVSHDKFRALGMYDQETIRLVKDFFPLYQKRLLESNNVDFDDLIVLTLEIFNNNDTVVEKWRNRFSYILVDEFQDTNRMQFEILMHLINPKENNVFAVGDPDQTIYTWRGAYANIFNDYLSHFKNCKKFILDMNYRSSQKILDASNKLIKNNLGRIDKQLVSNKIEGSNVLVYAARSTDDESNFIAKEIKERNKVYQYGQMAILYRSNHLSRGIETALINHNIPYVVYGGVKFYQRKEIKDIIAYLKCLVNDEELSYKRIINIPKRNIGISTIDTVSKFASQNDISFVNALYLTDEKQFNLTWKPSKVKVFIDDLHKIKSSIKGMSVSKSIETILAIIKYEEYLKSINDDFQQRWENILELINYVKNLEAEDSKLTIKSYLHKIALYTTATEQENTKNSVSLMTIHAAKGLEFSIVFVIGINEGILPSKGAIENNDVSEERRIAYVAMTRAQDILYMTHTTGVFSHVIQENLKPSRFLKESHGDHVEEVQNKSITLSDLQQGWYDSNAQISVENNYNDETPDISIGDTIVHTDFGDGLVIAANDNLIEVMFKAPIGRKTINSKHKSVKRKI
ncbi:MAG: UvrD-helicase domain-containing protein [Mycoplasmoidaceae bacterium]|nr:MAG: UvrD-helicase domain-containing protein [Mycoplasmoidaceae bacterium]